MSNIPPSAGALDAANSGEECKTVLLPDEPESSDAFGPHQMIAEAIAELIRPPESKGVAIGIEGSWGSGKTTVVRLLEKILSAEKNIMLIPFDAWAHEGDPLRRSFIERLIRYLQKADWIDKGKWDIRVEEIANRREVVTTKDKLSLSGWGKFVAFTLLLVPVGGAFITAALRENVTFESTGALAWKFLLLFITGLILSFAPLIALLLAVGKSEDALSLLFNKGVTKKTTETIKTTNPTSIEFEEIFNNLMDEALNIPDRRVILILDNLDRVDSKDALAIWATLQTFLQQKNSIWHKRLWTIVLYDINGLRSLWENVADTGVQSKIATSFIDKSFQVRFDVPAPVLSDWSTFLMGRLKDGFPNHEESDLHEVYRVLAIKLSNENRLPTIRELKLYVNQIGSIHRQWASGKNRKADAFPLSHIAYYVLLRRAGNDINSIIEKLLKGELPDEYKDLLGSEIINNLPAIAFNVDIAVAQQLVFSNRIKDALGSGATEELRTIASLPKGFWEILEQIITTEWTGPEAVKIANAAFALDNSKLLNKAPRPTERTVVKAMCNIANSVQVWSLLDEKKLNGLAILIKWGSNLNTHLAKRDEYINNIFKAITSGLNMDLRPADSTIEAKSWLDNLGILLKDMQTDDKVKAFKTVIELLADQIRSNEPMNGREIEVRLEVLSELHNYPDANFTAKSSLKDIADSGHVWRHLGEKNSRTGSSVAWGLYVVSRYASRIDSSSIYIDTATHTLGAAREKGNISDLIRDPSGATVEKFSEILQRYEQVDILFKIVSEVPELKPFVAASLRIVLKEADDGLFSNDYIKKLEMVFDIMGDSDEEVEILEGLIKRSSRTDLINIVISGSFKNQSARLYEYILRNGDQQHMDEFKSWCLNGLHLVKSIEEWAIQLKTTGALLKLAISLKQAGAPVYLGQTYFDALTADLNTSGSSSGGEVFLTQGTNLAELLGPVDSKLRDAFRQNLYDLLLGTKLAPESLFQRYGAELKEQLLHNPAAANILNIFPHLLAARSISGLTWIKDLLMQAGSEILSKHQKAFGLRTFRLAIQMDNEKGHLDPLLTGEAVNLIRDIARLLNIRPIANGLIAFASNRKDGWEIYVMNPDGSQQKRLTYLTIGEPAPIPSKCSQPAWSPDGRKIAFTSMLHGHWNIFLMDANGIDLIQLTDNPEGSHQPDWSPDGQKLAFVRGGGPFTDIYTINIETREEKRITSKYGPTGHPTWSPDGARIAFHSQETKVYDICVVNADSTGYERITTSAYSNTQPAWSPDGQRIVYVSDRPPQAKLIYSINPDGTNETQITNEDEYYKPGWSPDGKKLIYQIGSEDDGKIYVMDLSTGESVQLTNSPYGNIDPSWQPLTDEQEYQSDVD